MATGTKKTRTSTSPARGRRKSTGLLEGATPAAAPSKKTKAKKSTATRRTKSTAAHAKGASPLVTAEKVKRRPGPLSTTEAKALKERIEKLESLLEVAKAMTAERDLDSLLALIVESTKRVAEADRVTLWVVDRERNELWTKVAQGLSKEQKIRIPLGVGIAGQAAATGDVINIPDAYADPRFNRQIDRDTGYRTRNILAVPMHYTTGEITGVLQCLNKMGDEAFTPDDEELVSALGANAAAAIENAILYEEIDRLFEGFVKASVVAIESRDPTTSGHSERVALLTLGIAQNLERVDKGPYQGIRFSPEDMREIRYAALLHDFGKVGVRENVLTKAAKLYPGELDVIETRFRASAAQREAEFLRAMIEAMRQGRSLPADYEEALAREMTELEEFFAFVRRCNVPTVLESGGFEKLQEIATRTFTDAENLPRPLLTERELQRLAIPRGSLDSEERLEIESHVTHTFRFLSQIPWTRNLRRVPEIAYGHHEKLDGAGYPRQLHADQIPVQARMMTVADIYDALTASDRPYKKAVPHEKALDILGFEVEAKKIDRQLLDIFIEAKVHETLKERPQ